MGKGVQGSDLFLEAGWRLKFSPRAHFLTLPNLLVFVSMSSYFLFADLLKPFVLSAAGRFHRKTAYTKGFPKLLTKKDRKFLSLSSQVPLKKLAIQQGFVWKLDSVP